MLFGIGELYNNILKHTFIKFIQISIELSKGNIQFPRYYLQKKRKFQYSNDNYKVWFIIRVTGEANHALASRFLEIGGNKVAGTSIKQLFGGGGGVGDSSNNVPFFSGYCAGKSTIYSMIECLWEEEEEEEEKRRRKKKLNHSI
ncbi:hypothetical protein ACTA71_004121 [Dictyostelium dimigraforme]